MKWPDYQLSRLAERFISGGTPNIKIKAYWHGDIPWITGADFDDGEVILGRRYINQAAVDNSATNIVPQGSILMVTGTGVGKIAVAPVDIAISQDITGVIPKRTVSAKYLIAAIKNKMSVILTAQRGATIKGVTRKDVENLQIPLPRLSEQRRIIEILDQADRLRKLRADADGKAQRILPALFIKMFGDPATNPMGWPVKKMGSIALDLRYGTSIKCSSEEIGLPVLRIPNVVKNRIDLNDLKFGEPAKNEIDSLMLKQGDILFVRTNGNRDYVGRCAVFDLDVDYIYASYLIRARLFKEKVDPKFVVSYLSTPTGRLSMAPFIRTTAGQSNISQEGLKQIPIPLPPIERQKMFCRKVEESENLFNLGFRRLGKIELLFSILLHRAFTGDLTMSWRKAHMKELVQEMERQSSYLEP